MKKYEPVEVYVSSLSSDGCGYSEDGSLAVHGALAGETVTAVPITRKRKKLYLRTTEVACASEHRVTPPCSAAAFCGGCSFQHVAHAEQLRIKQSMLAGELGSLAPGNWLLPLTAGQLGYRSKARLGVKHVLKKDRVLVGFREKLKPYIADIDQCPVLVSPVATLITPLAELISQLSVPSCVPQIELAAGDDDTALIFRHLEPLSDGDHEQLRGFGEAHQIQIFLQPGGIDTTWKLYPQDSQQLLTYSLPDYGLSFEFSPLDFTQVNLAVNREMVNVALSLLELTDADVVFDAFCGIGNFSLAMARDAHSVIGAEHAAASIDRAQANARRNDVVNTRFLVADLHDDALKMDDFLRCNKVLLDPPRSGAEVLVKKLAASENVERIVYVSCNPETLARDLRLLTDRGFTLKSAGIIDMFPHTTHVESIALLVRQAHST